eukprot:tig00000823_g4547.t1
MPTARQIANAGFLVHACISLYNAGSCFSRTLLQKEGPSFDVFLIFGFFLLGLTGTGFAAWWEEDNDKTKDVSSTLCIVYHAGALVIGVIVLGEDLYWKIPVNIKLWEWELAIHFAQLVWILVWRRNFRLAPPATPKGDKKQYSFVPRPRFRER